MAKKGLWQKRALAKKDLVFTVAGDGNLRIEFQAEENRQNSDRSTRTFPFVFKFKIRKVAGICPALKICKKMSFIYSRTIQFRDTDAAGVVYFANILSICHEAYEASLIASEIELRSFFGNVAIAIPITHASADFLAPMFCGDRIEVHLTAMLIREQKFKISYQLLAVDVLERILAKAVTEHVCIDRATRRQQALPPEMQQWMQQFS